MKAQVSHLEHTAAPDEAQVHEVYIRKHAAGFLWVCELIFTTEDAHGQIGASAPDQSTALHMARRALVETMGAEQGRSVAPFIVENVGPITEHEWEKLIDALDIEDGFPF